MGSQRLILKDNTVESITNLLISGRPVIRFNNGNMDFLSIKEAVFKPSRREEKKSFLLGRHSGVKSRRKRDTSIRVRNTKSRLIIK